MGKLTNTKITAALKKVGRYSDGDGLYLDVSKIGAASWTVRVQRDGVRVDRGLGSLKDLTLAEARGKASQYRSMLKAGVDPKAEREKAVAIPTFEEAARLVHAAHKPNWLNGKHQQQWIRTLELYAFKSIGTKKVSEITAGEVVDLLSSIWLAKPETARRVAQRVATVLDWAFSKQYRSAEAPIRSILKGLPRQQKDVRHHPALPYADLASFMQELASKETWGRLALQACILTAARSGELRKATWDQVDMKNRLWTVPAENMKMKKAHVVPLSAAAVRVFERAAALRSAASPYVFQGQNAKKPMSDMTLTKALRDMKYDVTAHGFRSTFRDWVADMTDVPGEVAEAALAHSVANRVEAAYRRTNLLEKRKVLMERWGDYCDGASTNVVKLAKAG